MSNKPLQVVRYREWVNEEADLIEADGCSFATNARKICCLIHDLEYYYAKDASHAYVLYLSNTPNYWEKARIKDRKVIDDDFIKCVRRESWLGFFSPLSLIRQLIKPFGNKAWDKHRDREKIERKQEKEN